MLNKKFECSAVLNWVEIELTNYCWLDCFWCIRKQCKNFWFLNFNTFKKIIFFIEKSNYKEIVLSGLWDVFLHKDLYNFIEYIFDILPNIKVYIMTKGQKIKKDDINRILKINKKWFNVWLTFSIFSLNKNEYFKLTWWWNLEKLLKIIKYSYEKQINFSFEFLLNKNNISSIEKYKKFSTLFKKEFFYSIPHNWGWNLKKEKYYSIFWEKELLSYLDIRKKGEVCEAFERAYLFFDYKGNIYKCWLKRFDKNLYLWNINNIKNLRENINNLDYSKCSNCSYFKYKTKNYFNDINFNL
jgi:hypothetical protein